MYNVTFNHKTVKICRLHTVRNNNWQVAGVDDAMKAGALKLKCSASSLPYFRSFGRVCTDFSNSPKASALHKLHRTTVFSPHATVMGLVCQMRGLCHSQRDITRLPLIARERNALPWCRHLISHVTTALDVTRILARTDG